MYAGMCKNIIYIKGNKGEEIIYMIKPEECITISLTRLDSLYSIPINQATVLHVCDFNVVRDFTCSAICYCRIRYSL